MKTNKTLIFIGVFLFIGILYYWFVFVYLEKLDGSSRFLGEFKLSCSDDRYTIKFHQKYHVLEPVHGIYYELERNHTNIIRYTHLMGTGDFDRENVADFSVACDDTLLYIIYDKTDTLKSHDLRNILQP